MKPITYSEVFTFRLGIKLRADYSDTEEGFFFRITNELRTVLGDWQSNYQNFAQLTYGGRLFKLGTAYWSSCFPVETIFEVILGRKSD